MEAVVVSATVSGTLKIVCNKLAPLLIKEYSSTVGVKEDLQDLHGLVEEINFWLEMVGDNIVGSGRPPFHWLKKLKDVSCDVDDIVDEFQLKFEKYDANGDGGIVSKYLRTIPKSFIFQCKAANKINTIKKRFAAIVKQRTDYLAITNSLSVDRPPALLTNMRTGEMPSLSNVDEASVVGRDEDKQKIISMLEENDGQQKIKIISIIGLGGSGKSTLAKLVFNDGEIIKKHFEVRLWVHVSQEFDVKSLVKKMFEAFADNNPGHHALPYMSKTISDRLIGKRFLLVFDDVWTKSQDEWEEFMVYIKGGAPGSRILLTTRNKEVAVIVGSTDHFDLPFLSPDDSWQLFQQSLVIPVTGWKFEFEEVGKAIVDKCGGVPLAIKVLAGALHGKERIEEWQAMRDKNLSNVNGREGRVAACLRLSYFHLPSNLKQCFAICSVFPKGHKIDKEQLIDQWIAHDMITLEDGIDYLEYVGHKHFNSLVQMSFLQNVEEQDGRVTCGMHDLVHDFAQFILGDEISLVVPVVATNSTKSYRYFSCIEQPENPVPASIFGKARAIYLSTCYDYIYGMAMKNAKHLRSVTVGSPYVTSALPETIFQIQNLKYLAMSRLNCEALPDSISDLWSLQALHLTDSFYLVKLPESIGKLKKLRTLNLSGCAYLKSLPDSIGDCHMISTIDLWGCHGLAVLPNTIARNNKLRVLRLGCTNFMRLPSSITTLLNLECLDLRWCSNLVELPEGIGNLKKLEVLNLKGCAALTSMPVGMGQLSRVQKLNIFIVGADNKSARISELANIGRNDENLTIRGLGCVMDPGDAHKACLKEKKNLQSLELFWFLFGIAEPSRNLEWTNHMNTLVGMNKAVLDGLEPPRSIKDLYINGYSGEEYAKWMLKQVNENQVQEVPQFTCLTVMKLYFFPNVRHLEGLIELPHLEVLEVVDMPALQSISGGPFPSLEKLVMKNLPSLGEVWMVPCGEEGHMQIGTCLSDLHIEKCPKFVVEPYFPSSLEHLQLVKSNESLLRSPGQGPSLSSSFPPNSRFRHLKDLKLREMTLTVPSSMLTLPRLGSRRDWELLHHMTALEFLEIENCCGLTELPESLRSLTSLRSLQLVSCSAICMLPEWLGELRCLQELTIKFCNSLISLPQSVGRLKALRVLDIGWCFALDQLPECLGELCSLCKIEITGLLGLTCLPQSLCGLTSLERLLISDCPDIKYLPQGIKGLTTLQNCGTVYTPNFA